MAHPTCRAFVCPLPLLLILAYAGWSKSIGPAPDPLDNNEIGVAQIRRPARPPNLGVSSNLVLIDVSVLD